jgi:hypothetical protein
LLRSLNGLHAQEPIRLVILTDNYDIQALSIENTSFITNILGEQNRPVSVVFSPQELDQKLIWHNHLPKILLILGNQQGIEAPIYFEEIEEYFRSAGMITLLAIPSPEVVLSTISDGAFDIIVIVGHSQMNDNGIDGQIGINDLDRRRF